MASPKQTRASLLRRAIAQAELEQLTKRYRSSPASSRPKLVQSIIRLSRQTRVLSDFTAMMVLETESDYQRFGIDRKKTVDILRVGSNGIDILRHTRSPPPQRQTHSAGRDSTRNANGGLRGVVVDLHNNPVSGAVVTLTGPGLRHSQSSFSLRDGTYQLTGIPQGVYSVVLSFGDRTVTTPNVAIQANTIKALGLQIDTSPLPTKPIIIKPAPIVDLRATEAGIVIEPESTTPPPPSRSIASSLDDKPVGTLDAYGQAIEGTSTLKNGYGINATLQKLAQGADELWFITTHQQVGTLPSRLGSGRIFAANASGLVQPIVIERTDISATIYDGPHATVTLTQRHKNVSGNKLDAVYAFGLPAKASVTDFMMQIGTRKIRGVIRRQAIAKKLFALAQSRGFTASLLVHDSRVVTQHISNIPANSTIRVTMTYWQGLEIDNGKARLSLPLASRQPSSPGATTNISVSLPLSVDKTSIECTGYHFDMTGKPSGTTETLSFTSQLSDQRRRTDFAMVFDASRIATRQNLIRQPPQNSILSIDAK